MINRVSVWLNENDLGNLVRAEPLGGGSINQVSRLLLDRGQPLILKENPNAPEDFFNAEAAGLQALQSAKFLRLPQVIHVEADYILLQDLGSSRKTDRFWEALGKGLSDLHGNRREQFGFTLDNYCGATPQRNRACADGYEFYAEQRLMALARQADDQGLLERSLTRNLEAIANRLEQWIPKQPAALLHGDLWSGNIHCCESGEAGILDPATYYGWPEAELAMTLLFGEFDGLFYESYQAHSDVDRDWRQRSELYNLYHLLNHLLLFGSSYLPAISQTVKRYCR